MPEIVTPGMEWLLFAAVAAAAALYIALPRRADRGSAAAVAAAADREELRAERDALVAALRDLDADAAAGRITPADRLRGRRALGPPLHAITERLREQGEQRERAR